MGDILGQAMPNINRIWLRAGGFLALFLLFASAALWGMITQPAFIWLAALAFLPALACALGAVQQLLFLRKRVVFASGGIWVGKRAYAFEQTGGLCWKKTCRRFWDIFPTGQEDYCLCTSTGRVLVSSRYWQDVYYRFHLAYAQTDLAPMQGINAWQYVKL